MLQENIKKKGKKFQGNLKKGKKLGKIQDRRRNVKEIQNLKIPADIQTKPKE